VLQFNINPGYCELQCTIDPAPGMDPAVFLYRLKDPAGRQWHEPDGRWEIG
jgi:hypothetical protein